jgi:hypothetical protein
VPVEVIDINDPPVIHTVGDMEPPVTVLMDEGSDLWLVVQATDRDGDDLVYEVYNSWRGARMLPDGTLHLAARKGEMGRFFVNLVVDDRRTGVCGTRIAVEVENVPDPPGPIDVLGPTNRSKHHELSPITFTVNVEDPDIQWGEVLEVVWESDVSGTLWRAQTRDIAHFTTASLPRGEHTITITVSDGSFVRQTWLEITVKEAPTPVEAEPPPERVLNPWVVVLFVIMPLTGFLLGWKGVVYEKR